MPRFKLLVGQYAGVDESIPIGTVREQDPLDPSKTRERPETRGEWKDRATRLYNPGDVIESSLDLAAMTAPRFERIKKDERTGRAITTFEVDTTTQPKFERVIEGQSVHDGLLHQQAGESTADFLARVQKAAASVSGTPTPSAGVTIAEAAASVQAAAESGFATAFDEHDTYEAMTVPELLKHAEEEEIDLKGAKKKDEIIRAIRAAQQPA